MLTNASYILKYRLIKTTKRLTFDILYQHPRTIHMSKDEDGTVFNAFNGYQVISRSRMDIQTERIWLLGCQWRNIHEARSGSMVFSDNKKRDMAYVRFVAALDDWAKHNHGQAKNVEVFGL